MTGITTQDGTKIHFKDSGQGQPIVFSHGWPLAGDAWEDQMFFLASCGDRCIAQDRRGHGRSKQTWTGNDMDTYADDLADLVKALDLRDVVHVGHSTSASEVARYIGRQGTACVAKAILIGAVPPLRVKTRTCPGGLNLKVLDELRASVLTDRSQSYRDVSAPFYGANRPDSKVSQGRQNSNKPTWIAHGDNDQIVPISAAAMESSKIVKGAVPKIYGGAPHGMCSSRKNRVNDDLLAFNREGQVPEGHVR